MTGGPTRAEPWCAGYKVHWARGVVLSTRVLTRRSRADALAGFVAKNQPGAPEAFEPSAEVENHRLALHWGRGTDAREKGHPCLGTRLAGASWEVKYSEAQPTGVRSEEADPRRPEHTHTHTHTHTHLCASCRGNGAP